MGEENNLIFHLKDTGLSIAFGVLTSSYLDMIGSMPCNWLIKQFDCFDASNSMHWISSSQFLLGFWQWASDPDYGKWHHNKSSLKCFMPIHLGMPWISTLTSILSEHFSSWQTSHFVCLLCIGLLISVLLLLIKQTPPSHYIAPCAWACLMHLSTLSHPAQSHISWPLHVLTISFNVLSIFSFSKFNHLSLLLPLVFFHMDVHVQQPWPQGKLIPVPWSYFSFLVP